MTPIEYGSPESDSLPSGTYLGLFHGRDTDTEEMEDFGYSGPMIGPITGFHVTYNETFRVGFETLQKAQTFFPAADDVWVHIEFSAGGCFPYEGKFYGDWTIFQHTRSEA